MANTYDFLDPAESNNVPMYSSMKSNYAETTDLGYSFPVNPNNPACPLSIMPLETMHQRYDLTETQPNDIAVPAFLQEHIGQLVRVEFLLSNTTTDRVGILKQVGANFIVLESLDKGSKIMCDLYSIRFVTILDPSADCLVMGTYSE